jgi:two-component system, LytTR family, sensor kinase
MEAGARVRTLDSYTWLALTPIAFWLAGRLVIRRANWWKTVPALIVTGVVLAAGHLFLFVQLLPLIGYRVNQRAIANIVMSKLHADVLTCWVLFGLRHAIEYYNQYRVRELTASRLEARLALAQVQALQMQLHPHFLFNTLHAVSALMYRNVEGADRMLARLSDFLRLTLDSAGVQEVPLKREMEYLDKYLDIEQVRFGDRLQVRRAIDPETLDLLVPNLVLQPLVENAVRYAVAPRAAGGWIDVSSRRDGGYLIVEVLDNGPGVTGVIREGIGLSNTRARLEQLYGRGQSLDAGNAAEGGFRIRLTIPARLEPIDASAHR